MSAHELLSSRHKRTGIISNIPASYLEIYPNDYELLDEEALHQHYIEVEEDKVVFALEETAPPTKAVKKVAKKEGK